MNPQSLTLSQFNKMTQQSPNEADLRELKDNYVNYIIDGLDMDSLVNMCYDLLSREYDDLTWDQLQEEIVDLYDEDTLIDLLPDQEQE
jgi:hypothetical protein|tara:strand:- start:523 stop:786 length:264 start_codon:yes stop_codon:yes gene_type:complete